MRRKLDRDSFHGLDGSVVWVQAEDRDPMSSVHQGGTAPEGDGEFPRLRQGRIGGAGELWTLAQRSGIDVWPGGRERRVWLMGCRLLGM